MAAPFSCREHSAHMAARADIYERQHGPAKAVGTRAANRKMGRKGDASAKFAVASDGFATETAKKIGQSRSKVRQDVRRGKTIPNVAALAGTSLTMRRGVWRIFE
jgi:hypothetical protein